MKGKFLIYAGLLAAAVGCTKESLVPESSKADRGITFSATLAEPATKGEYGIAGTEGSYTYPFRWMAEWDRISVYADNAGTGKSSTWKESMTAVEPNYKTTAVGRSGYFTAVKDEVMLYPVAANKGGATYEEKTGSSNFIATYNTTLKGVAKNTGTGIGTTSATTFKSLKLSVPANQKQSTTVKEDGRVLYTAAPMFSVSRATYQSGLAVGEQVPLSFYRVVPGLALTVKGVDDDLSAAFGNIASIVVRNNGYSVNGTEKIKPSPLTWTADAEVEVTLDDKGGNKVDFTEIKYPAGGSQYAELTFADGTAKELKDGSVVTVMIAPVNREAFVKAGAKESVTVTYMYDKVTLVQELETASDWTIKPNNHNGLIGVPALDMANYKYLVLKNDAKAYGEGSTLVILEGGKIADALNATGTAVKWDAVANGVDVKNIGTIISYANLGTADLANVAKFKNLKSLTLKEDTTLPKDMLKGVTGLTTLVAPKVKAIDPAFTDKTNTYAMVDLELPSYVFDSDIINAIFFSASASSLETLDMSAQTSFEATFSEFKTISFKNFTALETVKLNENGTYVKSEAFAGCTALKEVVGKVDVTGLGVTNVFNGCKVLKTINLTSNKIIPEAAFKGCTVLENVLVGGKQVEPLEIGASAFEDCSALKLMNLANATEIGAAAFRNAVSYVGIENADKDGIYLNVGVSVVKESTFQNTALVNVKFPNATKIQPAIFRNNAKNSLKHIQFDKVFTCEIPTGMKYEDKDDVWTYAFGSNSKTIYFYVNEEQTTVKDNTLTINWTVGTGQNAKDHSVSWTFANIAESK